MKILIIDEDKEAVEVISRMVRKLGHRVVNKNGETGLSDYGLSFDSSSRPDVVFLDADATIMMGVDALSPILMTNPRSKIILTTRGSADCIPSCDCALGVFSKPMRIENLRKLLKHAEAVFFPPTDTSAIRVNRLGKRMKRRISRGLARFRHHLGTGSPHHAG